jgi:hypothetical protein
LIFQARSPDGAKRNPGLLTLNSSPEQVDAWHAAGIASGRIPCEDPPGIRQGPGGKLYLAYLRDLDGNKICAMRRLR